MGGEIRINPKGSDQPEDCIGSIGVDRRGLKIEPTGCTRPSSFEAVGDKARIRFCGDPQCEEIARRLAAWVDDRNFDGGIS